MTVSELIRTKRAVRQFTDEPLVQPRERASNITLHTCPAACQDDHID